MKILLVGVLTAAIFLLLIVGCGGREASGEPIPAGAQAAAKGIALADGW